MVISLAICTHNEGSYIDALLTELLEVIGRPDNSQYYEIVLVDDFSTDPLTVEIIERVSPKITVHKHRLNNDFATHKNFMNSVCTGDWIFNLDADERCPTGLLDQLPLILESNPSIDAYWLPRINTVAGLTLEHVRQWGWIVSTLPGFTTVEYLEQLSPTYELLIAYNLITAEENGYVTYNKPIVNWPDPQLRLFRNTSEIKWVGAVHETIQGFTHFSNFPMTAEYALRHDKEIVRQEQQNEYYKTLR